MPRSCPCSFQRRDSRLSVRRSDTPDGVERGLNRYDDEPGRAEKGPSKGVASLFGSNADVDAFPAEQPRIDGPRTWTDERQGSADGREEEACQRILGESEREPDADRRDKRAGKWRPQADEQQESRGDRHDRRRGGCGRWPAAQRRHGARDEGGSADEPHDEETHARPAPRECRAEPAHLEERRGLAKRREPPKEARPYPFGWLFAREAISQISDVRRERARERATRTERAGAAARESACGGVRGAPAPRLRLVAEADDAAPDADDRGVGAIVGAELRQDVLDPALDRVLGHGETIGDLLVGV